MPYNSIDEKGNLINIEKSGAPMRYGMKTLEDVVSLNLPGRKKRIAKL